MNNGVKYFVTAESVIKDKWESPTIVRIFNSLGSETVPTKPKMAVAFTFIPRDLGKKDLEIKVQITDLDDNPIITYRSKVITDEGTYEAPPKGLSPEVASSIDLTDSLELPKFGVYKAKLFYENEQIAETRFELEKKSKAKKVTKK